MKKKKLPALSEDEQDIKDFDKAYKEFLKNPKTYSTDEVIKILGDK